MHPGNAVAASPTAGDRLISNALINYSALAVGAVVGILLVPFMLANLGTPQYGLWVVAVTLAASLRTIDFGLGLVVMREVAAAGAQWRYLRTVPLVNAAGGAHVALGVVGAVLLVAAAALLEGPLRLPAGSAGLVLPVFVLVGVALVGEQVIAYGSAVLAGLHRFATVNGIGIALVLSRALGIVVLLLLDHPLVLVASWYALSTLMVAAAALALIRRSPGGYGMTMPGRGWRALRSQLPFGVASFLSVTAAGLQWQALPLLTAAMLGAGAVVSVHVGQKIPLALTAIYGRLATVVFPAASEYHRSQDVTGTRTVLLTGTRLVVHLMVPVVVVGIVAAPDVLSRWVGNVSPEVVLVFRLTLVAVLADALASVAVNLVWGQGRVRPILAAAAVSTTLVVGGSLLLLPRFGVALAAAWLALVLAAFSVVFWILASQGSAVAAWGFARDTARGIVLPALSCTMVVLISMAIPGIPPLPKLLLAAAAGATAYFWILARFGSTLEERQFLQRLHRRRSEWVLELGRATGRHLPWLRSLGYLLLSSRAIVRHPDRAAARDFDRTFEATRDPWNYGSPEQQERIDAAIGEIRDLAAASEGGSFDRALEIGCAEGMVTALLAPHCRSLVAIDVSATALARCEEHCRSLQGIVYRQSDALGAVAWGPYRLVVAMDVLECIRSPRQLRRTRDAIAGMLVSGGYLLVTTTRQHPVPESAWWGRWVPIGARINEYVGRHPGLVVVRTLVNRTHAITVYRKGG